jgi:hypothetical protein
VTTPGGIGPERLGEIVDGAAPRDDEERALLALMEETRALEPGASEALRRRVLDGPPPQPVSRAASLWRRLSGAADGRRRLLTVGAPVAAGLVALAIAIPVLNDGDSPSTAPESADAPTSLEGATAAPESGRLDRSAGAAESAPAEGADSSNAAPPAAAAVAPGAQAPVPATGRARKVTAETRVQVEDVEALSSASTSAMRTVRALGGFTASSDYDVPSGAEGTNRLVFRVPVDRAEDALAAFGRLGVVTGQSADIVDLTERLGARGDRADALRATVAGLRARAAADPGDAALAAELARAEASLARAEAQRAATERATRLATLRLTLTTQGPPPPITEEGRFMGPLSRAGARLGDATAWLLGALVLVGPFVLLAAGAGWGALRLRGRSRSRLMGSA